MRQIVFDTETTGHEFDQGDRVVEIGCVELINRRPSGKTFQRYLNPDRDSHPAALKVHGLTTDFLSNKPRIAEVVDEFLDFIRDAELVIHNAAFDVGFMDAELQRCGPQYGRLSDHVAGVIDTYKMARQLYPGQRASLDTLCRRLGIDNSERQVHGALLDAGLLLEVYLAMTSGQFDLGFGDNTPQLAARATQADGSVVTREVRVVRANGAEQAAHASRLEAIEKASGIQLWPVSGSQ